MEDGGKFVNLMEGCTRQEARSKKIEVQHWVKEHLCGMKEAKKQKHFPPTIQPSAWRT